MDTVAIMGVKEVSIYLRCHPTTIYRLIRKGGFPGFKVGSDYRFRKTDIDMWIDKVVKAQ